MSINTHKKISEILQKYLETYDKDKALNQILSLITHICSNSVPYILTVSKKEALLTHLVSSKIIDTEYKKLLQEVPIDKNGSACGSAAFYKKRVILDDPIHHDAYKGIKKILQRINLLGCWAFPILNHEKNLVGTLSLYFTSKQEENNKRIKELESLLPFIAIIIDHHKKEEDTKEHNTLFNEIEKFSKSYIWQYNLETKEVWWSKNSYNLLKLDSKEHSPSYETFYNLLTEQSKKQMAATIESMLKTKQKKRLELTFTHLPDQIFYEEKNIICNKQGDPIKLIGIIKDITEERALEKERKKLDERLQILTNNLPGMVYSFKIDQNNQASLLDCNDYVYNIYEITKNKALKDVNLLFNQTKPQYQQALFEAVENSRKSLTLFEFEGEIITPSGKEKWTTCQAWPKKKNDGSVIWTGIILDTTEKNRIKEEKKIAEIEAEKLEQEKDALGIELTQLIDTANAPIFGIDKKGNVNEWNQKAEEITGYSKEEVRGKSFVETYITEEYKESVKNVLTRALNGEESANYEVPIFTKRGQRIMVLLNATTRRNMAGKIIGVVGVGQDITEINEARQELSNINRHFIQSQEASLAGSWEWDIQKNIIWWSDETYKIFEVKKESFHNTYENYLDLLNKESQEKVNRQVKSILEDGQPYIHIIQLRDHKEKYLEGKGYLIKDKQGNNQKLIGIIKDISVEHKLETQLKESQERRQALFKKIIVTQEDERKRLARDVHDDLGQQLAYLKIKLELAKKETMKGLSEIDNKNIKICGSSSCSNSLQELDESIHQLQKTIQTTREIAKELRPPQLDLLELKDLIESHINQLNYPNIKIMSSIKINENEISTTIKETIYRILKEGLENSIKHANPKAIKVDVKSRKKEIYLKVIDDGRGFKPDDIIKPGSFGLIGIEEQLVPLNGAFTIRRQNHKTILETRIPI
ncbi:MAG: hypothetical protein CL503_05040 [Actinobacteria bacterium]|nr:hypothetical protein [Actinomycetota bacterium]